MSHPFLNRLISHNFDLSETDEIVDYFVSFLKMLALKINSKSVQFFYNKRFKDFPLYGTAISLFNHPESMVRTASRTVTLQVYSVRDAQVINAVLSLPHAAYFPHLACEIRRRWMKIDKNLIDDLNVDDLRDDIDDVNDTLMYFQDIFNLNIPELTIALSNSLLYYAFFPAVIGSLGCSGRNPDINSYSASIFFLNQTYDNIKEPLFINALSSALFLSKIPSAYTKWIEGPIKPLATYSPKYNGKRKELTFLKYVEQHLSKNNIEGFIMADHKFLPDLQDSYQAMKEAKEEEEIDDTHDNSDDYQRDALNFVVRYLKEPELSKIRDTHLSLSIALGKPIGVWEKERNFSYLSPTDYSEAILDAIYNDTFRMYVMEEEFVVNKHSKTLINFLRSKDDSLLLLIGSLLYCYTLSDTVDPALLFETKLYPIGNRKKSQLLHSLIDFNGDRGSSKPSKPSKLNFEEEKSLVSGSRRDQHEFERSILEKTKGNFYDERIVNMLLDLLKVDPPFRPITLKFLAIMICNFCNNKTSKE